MQHLQPNTTLKGGQYRIERMLGQGGFGNTYVGINTAFEEKIAIKEFFMQGINDRDEKTGSVTVSIELNRGQFEDQREKFKKEARRLRKLKNKHIVNVHDLFEENGTAYYVMDYVDGENLAERLKRTGKTMSEGEVREMLPEILDALKTVHDAGIWHLDLKPANIMMDKNGCVKLIDFGASKQLNAQKGGATTSTAISYTNGYAPREQMEQNYEKFGPWTDIYALGATLYTLLTKKLPPLPTDIDDDISEDKHISLPFSPSVSEGMKFFILQLMHTNRMQRPQCINDVKSLFDNPTSIPNVENDKRFFDEETIVASPPKAQSKDVDKTEQTGLEKRIWWGVVIGTLSLLVIAGIIYLASSNSGPQSIKSAETTAPIAVVEDIVANNVMETGKTSTFGNYKYIYSGNFFNQKGKYPVKLTFKCVNGEIKECVYHNVKVNKDIVMTGKIKDNKLEFYARDDNADFIMRFSLDVAPSKLYGLAYIGNKTMNVNYDLVKQTDLSDSFSNYDDGGVSEYNWEGSYEAMRDLGNSYGGFPITINVDINLKRSADRNKYNGTIDIGGYQMSYATAQIEGYVNDNKIRIYFTKCDNDNGTSKWRDFCEPGRALCCLTNNNGKIDAEWFSALCGEGVVEQTTKIKKVQ